MSSKAREMVAKVTAKASSKKEWKAAIRRMHALFGKESLYYIDCTRFIKEGDEGANAFPYEEWKDGKKIHYGVQVQHSYYDGGQYYSYGDEVVLLA